MVRNFWQFKLPKKRGRKKGVCPSAKKYEVKDLKD